MVYRIKKRVALIRVKHLDRRLVSVHILAFVFDFVYLSSLYLAVAENGNLNSWCSHNFLFLLKVDHITLTLSPLEAT